MATQRSVLDYLDASAQANPCAIAVVEETGSYTYAQLRCAARVAGTRLAREGSAGRAVIVFLDKGFTALSTMMGALYAGSFYVPVDPSVPASRLQAIVRTLEQPLIVASEATEQTARAALSEMEDDAANTPVLLAESLCAGDETAADDALLRKNELDTNPVYVLFTSGSTGVPKGVAVSHRAVIDFIESFVGTFGFTSNDRFANQAPFDFDVSVKDIYSALSLGATLVVVPRRLFSIPAQLVEYLDDNQVTVMIWAVAALCLVSGFKALEVRPLSTVEKVLFSGEVMPLRHLKTWLAALPQAMFVNLYGPTEITCNCSYHVVDRTRDYTETGLPLGGAFANRELLLVDEQGRRVTQLGEAGEILVRGSSLALGYVAAPEQTARAFTQNPLHNRFPDRVYRTGDMAVLSENGELFYAGRRDNQIKHQGHRIELEEIDAAFERVDGVTRCRSAYDHKRQRLYAFYEGPAISDQVAAAVRAYLLPALVPSKIIQVDAMPLTKNGKVDRALMLSQATTRKR